MEIETRSIEGVEVREGDGDSGPKIRGYAATFDQWSPDYGDGFGGKFREIVRPGAFTDTLKSRKSDVRALFNHNPERVLGRVKSGTMHLEVDDKGLRYTIDVPESASDVLESIRRGDITGSSFSFTVRAKGETWGHDENGLASRELLSVDLLDVGPVPFPFYPKTTVATRSLERWRRETERDVRRSVFVVPANIARAVLDGERVLG